MTNTARVKTPKPISKSVPWWQTAVIYQLYVRSFFDTNADGVGDLPGVIAKLGYLGELGVDAIWLSPITESANVDWGYDVSDYYTIDPTLGSMDDFEQLMSEADKAGIKIIMDLVPNHTSNKHPWFQSALTGRHAKYRDYYIWADPKPDGRPPNNWRASNDGGSTWEYHSATGQYYLHNFFKAQPDLNWRNPAVLKEFDKIMRFWLDKGVAGFRLDVFNMIIKDSSFRDNPKSLKTDEPEIRLYRQRPIYNTSQPEVHSILKRWRLTTDDYPGDRLLLGETNRVYDMKVVASFYGNQNELQLIFNLAFVDAPFKAPQLRDLVTKTETEFAGKHWPAWTGSNHDKPRLASRWAAGDERKIRAALLMLLGLRGTPVLYYGDELGMEDVYIAPWRLKDPQGRKYWPVNGGRDRARTPMPWKNQFGAGFTEEGVRPWLPYGDLRVRSVASQNNHADSTLQFSKDLISFRRNDADLLLGEYEGIPTTESVWAWKRGKNTVVAINYSNYHHEIKNMSGKIIIGTQREREGEDLKALLHLDPWEGVILKIK